MRALRKPDHAHPTGRPLQCAPTIADHPIRTIEGERNRERQDGVHANNTKPAAIHGTRQPERTNIRTSGAADPADGLLNINTAGSDELQTLKGVGPVTAQRIIDYRNQIGRFDNVDQLLEVKGIGEKTLAKFRDQVCAR